MERGKVEALCSHSLECLLFHFEPERPSQFPEHGASKTAWLCTALTSWCKWSKVSHRDTKIATAGSLQFRIQCDRKSFHQKPTHDGQYLLCRRTCSQVSFIFGAGVERVFTSIPKRRDCYLYLSQQSDISQCALTTGVPPLITSCNKGSPWQHWGWKVKAIPSSALIVPAEGKSRRMRKRRRRS